MAAAKSPTIRKARVCGILAGLLLFSMTAYTASAIFVSSPTKPILTGDITTTEILDGTIVGADFNQSTGATTTTFGVRSLTATGTITASGIIVGSTTPGTLIATSSIRSLGTLRSDGATIFNTVSYTWPSADGGADTALTTNASGVLSWASPSSSSNISSTTAQRLVFGDWVVAATSTNAAVNKAETSAPANNNFGNNTNFRFASCYSNSSGMLIRGFDFFLDKVGTPTDNLQVTITPSYGSIPATPYAIASSTLLDGSTLTGSAAAYRFSFDPAIYQAPYEPLCYVMARSGAQDASNYYRYYINNTPTDGNLYTPFETTVTNSWTANGNDTSMRIFDDGQTAGRLYLASSLATTTATSTLGVAQATVATSSSANIAVTGVLNGFTNLVVGKTLYMPSCYRCIATETPDLLRIPRGTGLNANLLKIY